MTTYQSTLHIKEGQSHPVYGRVFAAYFEGCANILGPAKFALTSSQAIACKVESEKKVFQFNQEHANQINLTVNMDFING